MMPSIQLPGGPQDTIAKSVMLAIFAALRDQTCKCRPCEILRAAGEDVEKTLQKS